MPFSKFTTGFNWSKPFKLLAVAVIYTLAYRLIADYLDPEGKADLFFVASGIALAALLLGGRIYALSVFFGCLLANLWGGLPGWVAISIAASCTLNALIGCALVSHKNHFDSSLKSLSAYLRLIFFGGLFGSIIGALIGTTTLQMARIISADQYAIELLRWLIDDFLGVALITPLILIWQKSPLYYLLTVKNWLKITFIVCVTWLTGQIVFLGWFAELFAPIARGYWLFAIVILTANYLGRHGTLPILLMITTQAMIGAMHNVGFFANDLEQSRLINLYFYTICLSLVGVALAIHIGERRRMESALRDSEEQFKSIFNEAPLGIALVDSLTWQIYAANPMFAKIAGRTVVEVTGINRISLAHPDDIQQDLDNMALMLAGKISSFSLEKRYIHPDGTIVWVNLSVAPMLVEDKTHPRHHCIIEDITEHKQLESALRDSEEQFKSIFNEAPLGIALVDSLTWQIYAANPMFAKIAGRTVAEVTGMNRISLAHPDDIQQDLDNMALMLAGKIGGFSLKKRYIRPDGSIVWVNLSVAPMLVEDKTHPRHHCIIEDITERKQLEDAQLFLLECGYKQSGEDFFTALAHYLAKTLAMDYVCIARLSADKLFSEPVVVYFDGQFLDNSPYILHNTPCGKVIGNTVCCFAQDVGRLFPEMTILQDMKAESYIGVTLWGFDGEPNGLIALISRKPLTNQPLAEALLKLLSIRVAGELERQRAESELRIAATVFESQEGIFVTDADQGILKVNQNFTKITGYTAADAIGKTPTLLSSGRHDSAFYHALWQSINQTGAWQGEIWDRRKNGEIYPQWLTITAVKTSNNEKVTHYVATLVDITEYKQAEEQIKHLAFYDTLTNLPNRRALYERMKYSINLARRTNKQMAILMLDLDKFKPVNDSLGHAMGDLLLQQVAERIKARLREVDMVARLGGDEFVILLDEINQQEDVARIAQDIIILLSQPFMLQNNLVQIGTSIGISLYPEHGDSSETLLDNADAALYLAKKQGRGCLAYFSEQLTDLANQRISLEKRLRRAIEQQQLCIHYQPQIDINTGRIIGAEALVRWQDPNVGLIFPDDFMPIAETSNLFLLIAEWVLTETCKQGRQWLDAGLPALMLTINMSPQQFQRGELNNLVANTLAETGFPATQLELEIDETGLIQNQTLKIINNLHQQGIHLAIDNFGTGCSSFVALKHFPLSTLKIDKTFIKDIPSSTHDMTIITTIINMAHNLGFKVLAKGVETDEQLVFLKQQGCDRYQGYYYSEALPATAFIELLRNSMVSS